MTVDMDGHHLIRLDAAGRVVEGLGFAAGQDALDALPRLIGTVRTM